MACFMHKCRFHSLCYLEREGTVCDMGSLLQCFWLAAKGKGWIQFLQTSSKVLPWAVAQKTGYF